MDIGDPFLTFMWLVTVANAAHFREWIIPTLSQNAYEKVLQRLQKSTTGNV